ncbi:MAG: branched-chain amino acid transport system permease protein [Puniceicoccaceae bacterium 5H]|nr:MAG: branched-chain amino acid transport system permease protein [Puniceicoccaceae bacterium 5H]
MQAFSLTTFVRGLFLLLACCPLWLHAQEKTTGPDSRALFVEALTADNDRANEILQELAARGATEVRPLLEEWRAGGIYAFERADAQPLYVTLATTPAQEETSETYIRNVETDELVENADGDTLAVEKGDLDPLFPSRRLRRNLLQIVDLIALGSPEASERAEAAIALGLKGDAGYLTALQERREIEENGAVQDALDEGIALAQLSLGDRETKLEAVQRLDELNSIPALDRIRALQREATAEGSDWSAEDLAALQTAIHDLEGYLKWVDFFGTAFRGLSAGAVLLVVALGLAITFGLMGVINMAHGEMIALGAYTVYFVQQGMAAAFGPIGMEWYFPVAIPVAFLVSALAGLILERSVIQFLYKRPLESLLATWGVSWILQQAFKLLFGAQNKNVESPTWLLGNITVHDISLGYNRLFIIGFAILILVGTWLLLTKTPLGLCIRAVMQNPQMAASMGISTSRTRMATFAFGSGLAGLAGAFLSQIGSVGSGLGQTYIVDSFMVVVAGGVGNLLGTLYTALGIGVIDNTLQPFLGPVMGKICVLFAIILFLQWKPGGLFPARSRALD